MTGRARARSSAVHAIFMKPLQKLAAKTIRAFADSSCSPGNFLNVGMFERTMPRRELRRNRPSKHLRAVAGAFVLFASAAAGTRAAENPATSSVRPVRPSVQPAGSVDPATIAKLNEELLSLQHRIREERAAAAKNRISFQERVKELKAEERLVSRSLDALKEELARREKELTEKKKRHDEEAAAVEKLKAPSDKILAAARTYLEDVRSLVVNGIPWKIDERTQAIDGVLRLLSAKDASASSAVSAAARIHAEEEALGRLVESAAVNVSVGKEEFAVEAFHLGLIAVIFASEDASILGFARAGETLEDGLQAARGNPAAASGYLAAVDILRRRRTPSLVDLFIPAFAVADEESENPAPAGGGSR